MNTPAPQPVAGFRVQRRLAGASRGELHLATRERDGLLVALKLLHAADRTTSEHLACLVREYELASRIAHPHVIRVYEAGTSCGHAWLAMEYLERGDLRQELAGGLPRERVLQLLRQLALALDAIHANGIVHGDLKPANVLLRGDGGAVLADFGIARGLLQEEDFARVLAGQGAMVGTPFYVSPEQAGGKPATPASDLYSLGVLLHEMLTGERPYRGDSLRALLDAHLHAPVPQLPEHVRDLQPVLERLLAKQPQERYASARALLDALG